MQIVQYDALCGFMLLQDVNGSIKNESLDLIAKQDGEISIPRKDDQHFQRLSDQVDLCRTMVGFIQYCQISSDVLHERTQFRLEGLRVGHFIVGFEGG